MTVVDPLVTDILRSSGLGFPPGSASARVMLEYTPLLKTVSLNIRTKDRLGGLMRGRGLLLERKAAGGVVLLVLPEVTFEFERCVTRHDEQVVVLEH